MEPQLDIKPFSMDPTGRHLLKYAEHYREAAQYWLLNVDVRKDFDPVPYYLLCLSLELHLKSFIWLQDRVGRKFLKDKYGHNLTKLWRDAKEKGIGKYARCTTLRDSVISLAGPLYKDRKFNYLDLNMVERGYKALKSEPRTLLTLDRLTGQLSRSLREPVRLKSVW